MEGRSPCLDQDLGHFTPLPVTVFGSELSSSQSKTPRNMSGAPRCVWECSLVELQVVLQASQLWLRVTLRSLLLNPSYFYSLLDPTCELLIFKLNLVLSEHWSHRRTQLPQFKSSNSVLSFGDVLIHTRMDNCQMYSSASKVLTNPFGLRFGSW